MTKEEVQLRVFQNGKLLSLDKFEWNEKTRTFSSNENGLTLDFYNIDNVTFNCCQDCTFNTGGYCTFYTKDVCTFKVGSWCTFKTGNRCTFDAYHNCTFKAGNYCTFDTGSNCTFKTGHRCTFNARTSCKFDTSVQCAIIRRDMFQVITPKLNEKIQLCPPGVPGYISQLPDEDQYHMEVDGQRLPHIIADGILSHVINQKGNVYRVINHDESEESWLVTDGNNNWSHGSTLKEAKDDLIYKITERNLDQFKDLTMDSTLEFHDAVSLYRSITASCSSGTKWFIESNEIETRPYKVNEIIELTTGQYGHEKFVEFFS